MIQRIQTLYLLASCLLVGLMFLFPVVRISVLDLAEGGLYVYGLTGIDQLLIKTIPLTILAALCTVIPFVAIFLFKRRLIQIRLSIALMVLLGGLEILLCYYIYKCSVMTEATPLVSVRYTVMSVMPVISLILTWLGYRAILRDEFLIRSIDRIR